MAKPSSSSTANIMISINEKKTISIDLYRPFRQYIFSTYSEREAQSVHKDLETVKKMRSEIELSFTTTTAAAAASRRDLLQNYYKALCVIESRFPISSGKDHVNTITFTWFDAFKPKLKASQQNIHFEKAAVLFNLGALYSLIGLTHDRSSIEGCKLASHAFIAAAGAFAFLRDNASIKASIGNSTTLDVSVECAGMLERLMLAQAQECVFENTIAKRSTPGVCSKISRQVGLYYEEALAALNVAPLNQHFSRDWISHVQLKAALFYAEACYRSGLELHEKEEIGEEIARLNIGITSLKVAKKSIKGEAAQVSAAIKKLEVNLKTNLDKAMKENDNVYCMRVPSSSTLSPIVAFSMVKSMPMNEVLDASNEKLFINLVPETSAKALSKYTEMVDDIIRTHAEKMQQGSELARVKLNELGLPKSMLALEGDFEIPQDLKEDFKAVMISGGPPGLFDELQQLSDLKRVNHELLMQTEEILQKEAREDSQFRSQFGTRWVRHQSSVLTVNLQERLSRFAGNMKQAADSDSRIEQSLNNNSALMSILDGRPIETVFPILSRPLMSLDGNEDTIVGALKQSLSQLETLGAQRASLEDMLKEMKQKDDILPKLMTYTGSCEDLFKKEISKYDVICNDIAQNIQAQEQLLLQIQAQNNKFSAIFNLEDYKVSCEKSCKQIKDAIAKFKEIKDNVNEGMKFYLTLQDAISNVKQQCSDFAMTRNIQCREMIEDIQRNATGLTFKNNETTTQQQPYYMQPPVQGQYPLQLQQQQQQQSTHPRWQGLYNNFRGQTPYHVPGPYPPQQSGDYKPQ